MLAAALVAANMSGASVMVPAGSFVPEAGDFRSQQIRRMQGERDWPFVAEKGLLLCAPSLMEKLVYFVGEKENGEQDEPFAIDTDMMAVAIINMGRASALKPFDNFEQLLKRLSPFVAMGKRLCDQPAGSVLPENSL
ncbi:MULTISPECIES: hypothetical protein [Rhizobium/Agrobacterium group]|uniref:Uncharacterized protein n=1 Tax=Agrobacterium genomosp. 13 str. CFBP 6927 TaxID=1183428 RepID=A0ABP2BJW4_9HYPH|nr:MULTISPECIES: hypothetical protein [Agrobacterium tumefaciens complex]CUX45482.1 conserved hypothetical protein [Agrobacterium genomosp. 13 str. CFBP 6927]